MQQLHQGGPEPTRPDVSLGLLNRWFWPWVWLTAPVLASHQLTWRPAARWTATLDGRYQGRTFLAPVRNDQLTTPPFYVMDGGVRFEAGRRAAVHVVGRNLLDRRAYPSGDVSGSGVPRYFILAPRSADLTVTFRR